MPSLADLPEIVGFFSYSREDDEDSEGALSALRVRIQRELSTQLGRSKPNFRLWQDQEAIAPGALWESEIKRAVEQAVFFIPIITPRAVNSHYCRFEFDAFLAREQGLGRADLVFPLLYIRVPALESEAQWRADPVLSIVGMRQYVDWRSLRHHDVRTPTVREAIDNFCDKIVQALSEPWVTPEERRLQEAAAIRRANRERKQRAEAARRAEEERQRAEAARLAEEERQRAEATRQAEEKKRRAEATRLAEEERQRAEATRQAEEKKRRAEAAQQAEEERQSAEATPGTLDTQRILLPRATAAARFGALYERQAIIEELIALIPGRFPYNYLRSVHEKK
jgi:TIR domain